MMKKKIVKILSIVFVCIMILFIVYKVDSINRRKEEIIEQAKYLMDSIADKDYERIRRNIRNIDGTELSDNQIYNFLLNTGLYRTTLPQIEQRTFTYLTPSVKIFNTKEGSIVFEVKALNGDIITNKLKYVRDGIDEYFITDKVQECDKEKERYPLELNLVNDKVIEYYDSDKKHIKSILIYKDKYYDYIISNEEDMKKAIYSYVQNENGEVCLEVFKEIKEDYRIAKINIMYELRESLRGINEKYDIKWDDKFEEFSVYYDKSVDSKVIASEIRSGILTSSINIQALDGVSDWHLTVNYFDYNTGELLKTEIFR